MKATPDWDALTCTRNVDSSGTRVAIQQDSYGDTRKRFRRSPRPAEYRLDCEGRERAKRGRGCQAEARGRLREGALQRPSLEGKLTLTGGELFDRHYKGQMTID